MMVMRNYITLLFPLLFSSLVIGQGSAIRSNDVTVRTTGNNPLKFAWAGGLNSPQFSEIDLNMDGTMDLFVFDRHGSRVLTFLNNGTSNQVDYTYAPEYINEFPEMFGWALLRDFDGDGKNDIFTYNNGGIRVFRNTSSQGSLSFSLEVDPHLKSNYIGGSQSNLYVSSIDIPAIDDIDGDGDLDVLSFGPASIAVIYHENFASDSGSLSDFKFHVNTNCWGKFSEDPLSSKVKLNDACPQADKSKSNKHAGATLVTFDQDGNGTKELVLGDASSTNLVFLHNGGSVSLANITSQDTLFPTYDQSVDMEFFPAGFFVDVNNDGLKDLLVAPNGSANIRDHNSVWYYRNNGSASNMTFTLESKTFLQDEMIDLGSGAFPALLDFDFNGSMDLVCGNFGYYSSLTLPRSSLALFVNEGNSSSPEFALINDDFAGISKLPLNTQLASTPTLNVSPAFGDLNGDNWPDLIVGDFQGRLHYFENDASPGYSHFDFVEADYKEISVGQYAAPQILDIDSDGLNDLLIGNRDGNIQYYRNTGTKTKPEFEQVTKKLGNVSTIRGNDFEGYCYPHFYRTDGELFLICGSKSGYLYHYGNISNNLNGDFTLLDSLYLGVQDGIRSSPIVYDFDGDQKLELVVGNSTGGMLYYETDMEIGIDESNKKDQVSFGMTTKWIDPSHLQIELQGGDKTKNAGVRIYSIIGQNLLSEEFRDRMTIDFSNNRNGVYFVSIEQGQMIKTEKIILSK